MTEHRTDGEFGVPLAEQRSPRLSSSDAERGGTPRPVPWWALGCVAFVVVAVSLELLGSAFANSPVPGAAEAFVPLAWAPWARVVWWLGVAAATIGWHVGLAHATGRPRPVMAALTALPFLSFAIGIAFGASWATWH